MIFELLYKTKSDEQLIYDTDKKELSLMSYSNVVKMKFEFESKDIPSIIDYKIKFHNIPKEESDRLIFTNNGKICMELKSNITYFIDNKTVINITSELDLDVLNQLKETLTTTGE